MADDTAAEHLEPEPIPVLLRITPTVWRADMEHAELLENARVAIDKVGNDTSVELETNVDSLEQLAFVIDERIDTLREDIKNKEG